MRPIELETLWSVAILPLECDPIAVGFPSHDPTPSAMIITV